MIELAFALSVMLSAQSRSPVDEAAALEEKAFAAADEKRYCDAMHLFLKADKLAPNADLLFNAAQVASAAGDLQRALIIYAGLLDAYPDAKQRAEVRAEMDTLSSKIEKMGSGTKCPVSSTEEPATAPVDTAPLEQEPVVVEDPSSPKTLSWTLIAGGTFGVALGAVAMLVGSAPFMEYGAASERIRAAETQGNLSQAIDDQARLSIAANDWNSWGGATVVLGAVATTLGAFAIGGGAAWAAVESP